MNTRPSDPIRGVDLADPRTFTTMDTDRLFSELQKDAEVFWHGPKSKPGFWCVIGYSSAVQVLRSPEFFTSEHGMTLDTIGDEKDPGAGLMVELTDPPRHRRLRRVVNELFTADSLTAHEPAIVAAIEGIVADLHPDVPQDFVSAVAEPVTVSTASILFGLPVEDVRWLVRRTCRVFLSDLDSRPVRHEASVANTEILGYFARLLQQQTRGSETSHLVRVLRKEIDGEPLSDAEVLFNCLNLAIAATQTTRNTLTGMMALLAGNDAFTRLGEQPELVPTAVEESVRLGSPARHIAKFTTAPLELGSHGIERGDRVLTWIGAANQDPHIFRDPLAFVADRSPNPHIGFAGGPHGCVGAGLARVQMRNTLHALTQRFGSAEMTGHAELVKSNFLRGYDNLEITFTENGANLVDRVPAPADVPRVEDLANAKGLDAGTIREFGVRDSERGVVISYADPNGGAGRSRLRTALRGVDGSSWLEEEGTITAYWHPIITEIVAQTETILLVEGESDCWTAWAHGLAAIGIPGGAYTEALTASHLSGVKQVFIVVEPDNPRTYPDGVDAYVSRIEKRLATIGFAGQIHSVVPSDGLDDVNAMFRHHRAGFTEAVDRWLRTSTTGSGAA